MDWVREDLKLRMCLKEEEKKHSSEELDPKKVIVDGSTYRIGGSNAQWKDPFGSDETLRRKLKKSVMDNSDEDVFEQKYSLESKEDHHHGVKLPKGKPERLNSFCVNYQSPFKRDNRRHEIWIVRLDD